MKYEWIHKLRRITFLAIALYILVVYFIHYENKQNEIENERIQIEDVLMQIKAIRHYVSNDQKEEIYKLQEKGHITHNYFTSPLLSSTYSANKINDYYNEIKKEKGLPTTDIRFAAPNARNPLNKASEKEEEILNSFDNNKASRYEEIRRSKQGDILYIALPTKRLEAKCMRCHSTPSAAPSDLVAIYGNKAGFGEELGGLKALLSIEKPLNKAYERANKQTFKAAIYILIAILIFIFFYYRFNKQLYEKNEELELLNKKLDDKVKKRTSELKNSQMQLLNVINGSELGYWDWNIKEDKLYVNRSWLNMLGLNRSEFNNSKEEWFCRIHPNDKKTVVAKMQQAFIKGISFSFEYRIKHHNHEYIWIEAVGAVVQRDIQGEPVQASGIHRNINERKINAKKVKEQEIIIHNQAKVAAVGEMLKNISHQWKQPLSIITTIASTIKLKYELKQELKEEEIINYSNEILDNGNYLAKTINDFSSYFDNEIQTKQNTNISETLKNVESLIKVSIQYEDIQFINNIQQELFLELNENLFIQALLNILNNSCEAFESLNLEEKLIFVSARQDGANIVITIKDNALGVEEKLLDKIFEPYFTTKHQSFGTGIGLYMTNQVITKHLGGLIHAKNSKFKYEEKEYQGLSFKIEIPLFTT